MASIQANAEGKLQQAQKRLANNVRKLKNAGSLSPAQREALQNIALIDLRLIELWRLGRADKKE